MQPNQHYEIVFLVHPDHSDQVTTMLDRYRNLIESNSGKIHRLEDWGRRQLAYSINNSSLAHYILVNIECNNTVLNELTHSFRFNDAVLRHLVLKRKAALTKPSIMLSIKEKEEKMRAAAAQAQAAQEKAAKYAYNSANKSAAETTPAATDSAETSSTATGDE